MMFGTVNIIRFNMAGSLVTMSEALTKYKLDYLEVQEARRGAVTPKQQENTHI